MPTPGISPLTGTELPIKHGHHDMPAPGICVKCDAYRAENRRNSLPRR